MKNNIINYLNEIIPDPKCELIYNKDYELLISTMLSAQTTDKMVNKVTDILYKKYPSLYKLSNAPLDDLIEILKPLGNYNKKAYNTREIAKIIYENGGIPNERKFLESLPGVGRKTANVFLSNIYDEQCIAVDTHVMRVAKRLGIALFSDDVLTTEEKLTRYFEGYNLCRCHHQLLLFGRYYCKAINPLCENCKLKNICKKN